MLPSEPEHREAAGRELIETLTVGDEGTAGVMELAAIELKHELAALEPDIRPVAAPANFDRAIGHPAVYSRRPQDVMEPEFGIGPRIRGGRCGHPSALGVTSG
ncbi:MAG TPA: hypothetical protein PLQ63_13100, partial [Propionicimonas sp.]|nr:hypothetical protein [Propionicimonas sp.]